MKLDPAGLAVIAAVASLGLAGGWAADRSGLALERRVNAADRQVVRALCLEARRTLVAITEVRVEAEALSARPVIPLTEVQPLALKAAEAEEMAVGAIRVCES